MRTAPKKVSAYVPCYNEWAAIGRAVESILDQVTPAAEVFVLDDGSTDDAGQIGGVRAVRLECNQG
ncbi:MAG TPA: glycosyltransferase, partial [Candidatus Acidoferrum sp.]|nr:glycosyltransferase [Candidatus Acidoferrum sp.]